MNNPVLSLVLGTSFIGLAPIFVKFCDLAPSLIGLYRCGIAGITLLIFLIIKKEKLLLERKFLTICFVAGFFFAGDLFVWHNSVILIGPGMATVFGNTQAFYLLVIGHFLFHEKINLQKVLSIVGAFIGVVLIVNSQQHFFSNKETFYTGVLFGLSTGLFYASYTTTIKKANNYSQKDLTLQIITFASLFTAFWLAIFSFFEQDYNRNPLDSMEYLLALAFICQIGGWSLISRGLKKVPLSVSGLIILLQPVIAKGLGIIIFDEPTSFTEIVGVIILLFCIYVGTSKSKKLKFRNSSLPL